MKKWNDTTRNEKLFRIIYELKLMNDEHKKTICKSILSLHGRDIMIEIDGSIYVVCNDLSDKAVNTIYDFVSKLY